MGPFGTEVVNLWRRPMGSAGRLSGRSGPGTESMILAKSVPEMMVLRLKLDKRGSEYGLMDQDEEGKVHLLCSLL